MPIASLLLFPVCWGAALMLAAPFVHAQEAPIAALKDAVNTGAREYAFILSREIYAHGWILDAAIREMAWQREGCASKAEDLCQVAGQHPGLPEDAREAQASNHESGWERIFFPYGTRNADRRDFPSEQDTGHLQPLADEVLCTIYTGRTGGYR